MTNTTPEPRWHLFPDEEPPLDVPVIVEERCGTETMAERAAFGDGGLFWAQCYSPPWRGSGSVCCNWETETAEFDDLDVVAWHPLPERRKA